MMDTWEVPPQTEKRPPDHALTVPLLFMSSQSAGWDDILIEAYHEPLMLKGWVDPVIPETSLIILTHGSMVMEQSLANGVQKSWNFRQGDIFLKPGGSISREVHWSSPSPEPMQTLHIHLSQHLLAQTVDSMTQHAASHISLVRQSGFQDSLVTQIGLSLWQELECRSAGSKLYAQSAAQMLAVHLLRNYGSAKIDITMPRGKLSSQQINMVTEFVWANIREELSLDEMARLVGFSPYHFTRLFRQSTGHTPHQFVLRQRIEFAKRLIRSCDMPLIQVAIESGFASQSHMTQMFRRFLGITPKSYRELC